MTALVTITQITVRRAGRVVLRARSATLAAGEVVAVVGPNGCGKSTLLGAVAGVLPIHDGEITLGGHAVWGGRRARAEARALLGYVPEAADAPSFLRADELWALAAAARRCAGPSPIVRAALGLDELAAQRLAELSLGQRRRACLGAAFAGPPALLVLDEPDNGLDERSLAALVELLRAHAEGGGAVLVATHDPTVIDRIGARRLEP